MDLQKELLMNDYKLPTHSNMPVKSSRRFKAFLVISAVSFLVPLLLPFFHFGVVSHLWDKYNYIVNKKECKNACWDTVFKGPYERGPSGYKHVYFNATSNTLKIWTVTVFALLCLYETIKKTLVLLYKSQVRLSMLVLLLLSIYPHYYSWWSYFNYWNDEFYSQWNHQLFFSITEFASTVMLVHLMDNRIEITSAKCLFITGIAVLHIMSAGLDQFVDNVIRGNGMLHQVLRDIFFMIPDLFHAVLPMLELRQLARKKRLPSLAHTITSREFFATISLVLGGIFLCRII